MKHYDFKKAKAFIEAHPSITTASLGFNEDWFWTAETIYEDGKFTVDLDDPKLKIGGINGSFWATPTLEVEYFDGTDERIEVSIGEEQSAEQKAEGQSRVNGGMGCLSKPVQESRGGITRKI